MHPRFDRQVFLNRNDCIAAMAECIVRLSPYDYPANLLYCISEFATVMDSAVAWQGLAGMRYIEKFSLRSSTVFFEDKIMKCPSIVKLNERLNGNDAPYAFTSRFDGPENPDDSFIGLTALAQNMTCYFANKADAEAFLDEKVSASSEQKT